MFDYLVIGKGLMGAAATRYLSQVSHNVAVIGPDEPVNPTTHTGIFGAHYDEARIISQVINREPVWADLSHQTITQLPLLEEALGSKIWHPLGCLAAIPADVVASYEKQGAENAHRFAAAYEILDRTGLHAAFSMLDFPTDFRIVWEKAPAGRLNPRQLLRGQLAAAVRSSTTIVREIAQHVEEKSDHVEVRTHEGGVYRARKVLIATGAFSNCFDLLSRPLALKLKVEYVVLGEVPPTEVARLAAMPPLSYHIQHPTLADLYMFPPVPYPDGKHYIKMGANTSADRYVETLDEICAWYRTGDSDGMREVMRDAVCTIVPGLNAISWETGRCVITRTAHAKPYIDVVVPGKIYTAIGGNGTSAQASDGIGQVAANLVIHDEWRSHLDKDLFRLCYADEVRPWQNRELVRGGMADK